MKTSLRAGLFFCILLSGGGRAHGGEPVAAVPPRAEGAAVWFDQAADGFTLAPEDEKALVLHVFARVLAPDQAPPALPESVRPDAAARLVFLSISDGASPARVVLGVGRGLSAAADDALARARGLVAAGLQPAWVKLDLVDRAVALEGFRRSAPLAHEPSLFGLAFDRGARVAFLPEELTAGHLLTGQRVLDEDALAAYWRRRYGPGTATPRLPGPDEAARAFRFTTRAYFTNGQVIAPLYRGHRLVRGVRRDEALASARAAGAYLVRATGADGRFVYSYDAARNAEADDYNILRHASAAYSMLELHRVAADAGLLAAAERALGYLLAQVKPAPGAPERAACVVENDEVKLGGNALAILALVEHARATDDRRNLLTMVRLAEWIVSAQDPATGRFGIHKMAYPGGQVADFRSEYYPGEAILALVRLHSVDDDADRRTRWLDAAEKNALYLIRVRDAVPEEEQIYDHWLLYALNELHRARPNRLYLDHTRRISRVMLPEQHGRGAEPDWLGGCSDPPRSTPTAARVEGLAAAWSLLTDFGEPGEAAPLLEAIALSARFLLYTQVGIESAMYLADPPRCLGGVREGLTGYEIRIDFVQHHASAMLGCWRILGRAPLEVRVVPEPPRP